MAKQNSLPERLCYLQPFRKNFASRPDDLDEDTGEALLFALFNERIKGLSESDAQKLLEEDLAGLEEWLSMPEHENDCLQFVCGFLLVSPIELTKRILEESAKAKVSPPLVEIDLPYEIKMKRVANRTGSAMILKWKGLMILLSVKSKERAEKSIKFDWQERPKSIVNLSPVCFGNVHGTKCVRMTDLIILLGTNYKEVGYLLEVPGGCIEVSAIPLSKKINHEKWDESILEDLFHTLRVV